MAHSRSVPCAATDSDEGVLPPPCVGQHRPAWTTPSLVWTTGALVLSPISLDSELHAGSLLVAVLLRTAHRNLGRLKDVYLHTNMLAALTNLAPHFEALAPHASQRLVAFVDTLARRCAAGACHEIL